MMTCKLLKESMRAIKWEHLFAASATWKCPWTPLKSHDVQRPEKSTMDDQHLKARIILFVKKDWSLLFFFFSTSLRVVDRTDEFLSHVLLWAAVVIKCLVLVPFAFMYMLLGFLHGKTWISKWHPITPKILLQKIALNFYDLNFEKG